jgi:hypothetical protein
MTQAAWRGVRAQKGQENRRGRAQKKRGCTGATGGEGKKAMRIVEKNRIFCLFSQEEGAEERDQNLGGP